jgi:hypothetical protein
MATQLKNIVRFTNLAAGATIKAPHSLNLEGAAKVPDIVAIPAGAPLRVTADDKDLTITNTGDGPQSGQILVESWHTMERAFGAGNAARLSPEPFFIQALGPGGEGAGLVFSFTFRPGEETPGGNVFTDWAALVAKLRAVPGYKLLVFDDQLSPITIPVGKWDMHDVIWTGVFRDTGIPSFNSIVTVPEGATFNRLRYIAGPITVRNMATSTPPISDIVGGEGDAISIGFGLPGAGEVPRIENLGTAPFVDVSGIGPGQFAGALLFGAIGGGVSVSPVFRNDGPGAFRVGVGIELDDDMLGGSGPGAYLLLRVLPPAAIGQQRVFSGHIDRTLYSFFFSNYGLNPMTPMPPAAAPIAPRHNEVLRLDPTAGPIAQVLPDICGQTHFDSPRLHLDSRGMTVIVKNMAAVNDVTIAPFGKQTIDGGAGPVAIGPKGAGVFVSDGVSDWMRIV